ncbi:hypothetical protein JXA47_15430 [Candidatus Sumerlaeota bacterium]|nr:hypothetical protein [Candidatus Sumerlaeota bacterium]
MSIRLLLSVSLALIALGTQAQMASSANYQLESLAVTSGGGMAFSATHLITDAAGRPAGTAISASNQIQGGVIPTLYPRTLLGDANNDGEIDSADVVTAVEIKAGSIGPPAHIIHFFNADANTDNRVDGGDIGAIVAKLLEG